MTLMVGFPCCPRIAEDKHYTTFHTLGAPLPDEWRHASVCEGNVLWVLAGVSQNVPLWSHVINQF